MTSLLPIPEQIWFSNAGLPLAGGTINTYIPATTTNKTTWIDAGQDTANTNPIVLDSAGRAIIYGAGDYRFVVKDSLGNTIYDQLTSSGLSESAISNFMLPVVGSNSSDTFLTLSGTRAFVNTAIANIELMPGPAGAAGAAGATGPTGPAGPAGSGYIPNLVATNPGYASFPNANNTASQVFFQFGQSATDGAGNATVSFATPFPNALCSVVCTNTDSATGSWFIGINAQNNSTFSVQSSTPLHPGSWKTGPMTFNWMAIGW